MSEAGFYLVFDPEDDVASRDFLRSVHGRQGVVACEATASSRTSFGLAQDILDGLDKDPDARGAGRNAYRSWQQAVAWLADDEVEDLVVSRAHHLDPHRWRWLFELAAATDVQLWLVCQQHPLKRTLREAMAEWMIEELEFAGFAKRFASRAPARSEPRQQKEKSKFPAVPEADFPVFLAQCEQLLGTDDYQRVEERFDRALARARAGLEGVDLSSRTDVAGLFRSLVSDAKCVNEMTVCLRAIQVAFFRRGVLVKVDPDVFAVAGDEEPQGRLDQSAIDAAGIYGNPKNAAAVLLSAATGRRADELAEIDLRHLEADGSELCAFGESYRLPGKAAAIVRALLSERQLEGAGADDPLFVSRESGRRNSSHGLQTLIRRASHETGVRAGTNGSSGRATSAGWLSRHGISIHDIA